MDIICLRLYIVIIIKMEKLKMQESEADFSGELKDLESEIMNQAEKKT